MCTHHHSTPGLLALPHHALEASHIPLLRMRCCAETGTALLATDVDSLMWLNPANVSNLHSVTLPLPGGGVAWHQVGALRLSLWQLWWWLCSMDPTAQQVDPTACLSALACSRCCTRLPEIQPAIHELSSVIHLSHSSAHCWPPLRRW